MSTLYTSIYSQNISLNSLDENISKLFDLQFSEFYKNFKNFDVISNFIKYRYQAYMKYLEIFKPTSNIFPTLIKYNFGLNQVVNLSVVQSNDLSIYDLITKRGSKSIFNQITTALGISIAQEDILLVSKNPVRILGADSLKEYPPEYLNYFQDIDEIRDEDLPLKLPVMSLSYNTSMRIFDKYDTIIRALLFDDAPTLTYTYNGITLKEYFFLYLLLKQIIYNEYLPGEIPKYVNQPVITPVSFMFRYYMKLKYPDIQRLPVEEQRKLFLGFENDYAIQKDNFTVSTSNIELNDTLNNDIRSGLFITKLNMFVNSILTTTTYFKQDVFKSGVVEKGIYRDYFSILTNTLKYLKNNDDYIYFYSNIIKYLNDNSLVTFISDFSNICLSIQNILNSVEIVNQPVVLPVISTQKTTDILQTGLVNYYPLYMIIPDPTYEIKLTSTIHCKSGLEGFTDPTVKFYYNTIDFYDQRTHFAQTIKELRYIKLVTESYHFTIYVHENTTIELHDDRFHLLYTIKENTSLQLGDKFHVTKTIKEKSSITTYSKHIAKITLHYGTTIHVEENIHTQITQLAYSNIDIFDAITEAKIALSLTDIFELDNSIFVDNIHRVDSEVLLDTSSITAVQILNELDYVHFDQALVKKLLIDSQLQLQNSNKVLIITPVNTFTTLYNSINVDESVVLADILELDFNSSYINTVNRSTKLNLQNLHIVMINSLNSSELLLLSSFNTNIISRTNSAVDLSDNLFGTEYITESDNVRLVNRIPTIQTTVTRVNNVELIDESVTSQTNVNESSTTTVSDEDFTITEEE